MTFDLDKVFSKWAGKTATAMGRPWAFIMAAGAIVAWAVTGPMFAYSDTWELVINTGTTIVTFLMVFLIQNTQNRDAMAIHLKLDELIFAIHRADNHLINIETLGEKELDILAKKYQDLSEKAAEIKQRRSSHGKAGLSPDGHPANNRPTRQ